MVFAFSLCIAIVTSSPLIECTATVTGYRITLTARTNATRDIVAFVESRDGRYTKVLLERSAITNEYLAVVEWPDIALTGVRATAYNVVDVDTSFALSWSLAQHPSIHGDTAGAECSIVVDFASPPHSTSLPPCAWLTGDESTQRWSTRLWQPGSCLYTQPVERSLLEQLTGRCIVWLGDSQMRTTYQSMVAQICPDFAWFDFGARPNGWCNRNVTNERLCGGSFSVVGGNGCWNGGAVLRIGASEARDTLLIYGDVHNNNDTRFVKWLATNMLREEVRQRRCVVLLASGLHDQNVAIGGNLVRDTIARLQLIRRELQPCQIVQVGAWASEPSKRGLGYWWATMPSRVAAMNRAVKRAVDEARFEPAQSVRFVDLFRVSLAVCHRSPDGVHLAQPHPLDAVAQLLWHNIGAFATGDNESPFWLSRPDNTVT